MTTEEFDIIRAAIKSAYPDSNIMPDKYSIRMWYKLLGDLDFEVCETALYELFATNKFPPRVAEIREKCMEYMNPQIKDSGEAWEEVQAAVRKYGYYRADDAVKTLPDAIQQAVNRIGGFSYICTNDNPMVARAHFYKVYDAIVERQRKDAMLPAGVLGRKMEYIEMAKGFDEVLEAEHEVAKIEETSLAKTADPEYIDSLMRKYGFKTGDD